MAAGGGRGAGRRAVEPAAVGAGRAVASGAGGAAAAPARMPAWSSCSTADGRARRRPGCRDGGAAAGAAAMRWHGRRVAVYAYGAPTDMRKGFDGLCALVTQHLAARSAERRRLHVRLSRDRVRAKVLHFDGTGLCIYAKRLERGRFACALARRRPTRPITLTVSELDLFLDGSTLVGRVRAHAAGAARTFRLRRIASDDQMRAEMVKLTRRTRRRDASPDQPPPRSRESTPHREESRS